MVDAVDKVFAGSIPDVYETRRASKRPQPEQPKRSANGLEMARFGAASEVSS